METNKDSSEGVSAFFTRLFQFAKSRDRASLSILRKTISGEGSRTLAFFPVLGHALPKGLNPWKEADYIQVAGLFAMHVDPENPMLSFQGSLGESFRRLRQEVSTEPVGLDKRFSNLIESDAEDLPTRLRHAVSLLKAKSIPIDWPKLLKDLHAWNHPDRYVQKNWAREYWRALANEEPINQ